MNELQKFKEYVTRELEKFNAFYPVEISESHDDEKTLCVRIFAVPDDNVEAIEEFIFDLQDEIADSYEYILLPMVKNIATTRKYYSQHYIPDGIYNLADANKSDVQWVKNEDILPQLDVEEHFDVEVLEELIYPNSNNPLPSFPSPVTKTATLHPYRKNPAPSVRSAS